MTTRDFLLDPCLDFEYVSDSILWGKIFQRPLPVDLRNLERGYVELPKYFEIKTCFIDSGKGYQIERKALGPTESFLDTSREIRSKAFICMSNFLNRFNRPFRDCVLYVPNHRDIEPKKEYLPIKLYTNIPMLPKLNDKGTMMRVFLQSQVYKDLTWYCFKRKNCYDTTTFLDFSFECFGGFILQY